MWGSALSWAISMPQDICWSRNPMALLMLLHSPIKYFEFPSPHPPNVPVWAPAELAIYILLAAASYCLSGFSLLLLSFFSKVEEIRTHRILLWPASWYQFLRKDAWITNPEAGGDRFSLSCCLMALYPPPTLQENKGTLNPSLSSPLSLSRRGFHFTNSKQIPPTLQMRRNEMSLLMPPPGEESPKAT